MRKNGITSCVIPFFLTVSLPPCAVKNGCRVFGITKAIKNLLRTSHHPEFFTSNSFLRCRIGLNCLGDFSQRIDLTRKRIRLRVECLCSLPLTPEIPRAVLPALNGEEQSAEYQKSKDDSLCHHDLESVHRAARELS